MSKTKKVSVLKCDMLCVYLKGMLLKCSIHLTDCVHFAIAAVFAQTQNGEMWQALLNS